MILAFINPKCVGMEKINWDSKKLVFENLVKPMIFYFEDIQQSEVIEKLCMKPLVHN